VLLIKEIAMFSKPTTNLGLTLPELLSTVCVSGVLMALAIPSFKDVITNNRSVSIANQLVTVLNYARSEAIKRGLSVTVKHKGTTPRVWDNGWDIFTDSNGDGTINMDDELLKTYEALPQSHTLRTGGNFASWVAYTAIGMTRGGTGFANDTFTLCDSSRESRWSREIIIKMGRVRTQTGNATCQ
jgi:type IV fimbrial biogenesis protein FimT